jgi:TP901 family phage tail tape measure protein
MAAKVIETKLKITGEDHASRTVDLVAQKMRSLEQAANSANRRMDSVSRGMSRATWRRQAEFQAGIVQRMSSISPVVAAAAGSKMAVINQKMASIRSGLSDFATAAAPGTAGMMLGMGGAAVGGLAVGGAAAYGVRQAISFDKAMADVKKKVNLEAGATWADVEDMIGKTARKVGIAREEMAALAAQAGQSGIAYKDLSEFMMLAAKASTAWDIGAKEAAQTLAEIKAKTGWTNKELETYANKVNYLGDISAAAEKDISAMWTRTSSAAKAAGVSYDDAMVAMTAMRSVGMPDDVASRAFGQFSARLRTATSQKGVPQALKQLGLSAKSVEIGMQKDARGTIDEVLKRLGKSKDGVKVALGLGGKEWWDEFMLMVSARPEMQRLNSALAGGGAEGSLSKSLAVDLETTSKHLERFGALTSEVGDKLTRWALPSINEQLERTLKAFDTAKQTGFLAGPDGKPIERLQDKTPIPFGAKNRALFLNGARDEAASAPSLLSRFIDNSRPQITMPLGSDLGESAVPKSAMTGFPPIPSGSNKFGFGASGVSDLWSNLDSLVYRSLARAGQHGKIEAELKGDAAITNKIIVEPSPDFLVRVDQRVDARGALRSDVGVTMRQD